MARSKEGNKDIQVPLLKAYLRDQMDYPPHVPTWMIPLGWAVSLGLGVGLAAVADAGCMGFAASGAIGYLVVMLIRHRYRPRTAHESIEEERYEALRRLKSLTNEGSLERHVPEPVLQALEDAVDAYNGAVARMSLQDPIHARERLDAAQQSLHACFLASASVVRGENQSKKDWKAVTQKDRLINEVVATIDALISRINDPLSLDSERLAALRELEMLDEARVRVSD